MNVALESSAAAARQAVPPAPVATCQRCGRTESRGLAASTQRDRSLPFADWLISDDGRHLCPECGDGRA